MSLVYPKTKYHELNELIGMLECLKLEYYRKRIGPYEDLKEVESAKVEVPIVKQDEKY